jgi:hypothetical protein
MMFVNTDNEEAKFCPPCKNQSTQRVHLYAVVYEELSPRG